ncbi:MAG: 50S ribosomal protein L29 [Candidatus Rokubacteria bacterium]|nr:50S ribosomal protein L29 [Chloroflexota bacterium]MBM4443407.1 50S ribosomal protein L29 [Candidatus Rokubacteria bacterium]
MASRDTEELRGRADDELRTALEEAHQSLFNLRFQAATGQLADVMQVRKTKRRIARIHTLLREREILAVADAAASAGTGGGSEG